LYDSEIDPSQDRPLNHLSDLCNLTLFQLKHFILKRCARIRTMIQISVCQGTGRVKFALGSSQEEE